MKKLIHIALISVASLMSLNIQSEEQEKKFNLGIGTYALTVVYSDSLLGDDDLSGFGLNAMYAFTDSFAIRGEYYSLDHDDSSSIEATGIDLVAYIGTGLATQGFKAYIGGGLFSETWESPTQTEDFGGLQLNGGIGYNWDVLALDFVLGIRDASDYEEFIQKNLFVSTDAAAVSGSLILSARF
jgi:hypothetical protein